mmetsp:Transcript_20888/g.42641  ORF Transcript_20888/g.42641 Transcript_20888/m.42641 type:complete len:339 (-) Transcript_20888:137-1153(-)
MYSEQNVQMVSSMSRAAPVIACILCSSRGCESYLFPSYLSARSLRSRQKLEPPNKVSRPTPTPLAKQFHAGPFRILSRREEHPTRTTSILYANEGDAANAEECVPFDPELIEAAKVKLSWEVAADRQSRPILDLSGSRRARDDCLDLSEAAAVAKDSVGDGNDLRESEDDLDNDNLDSEWITGRVWTETRRALIERSILPPDNSDTEKEMHMLSSCPQLIRLPTCDIGATADAAIDKLGILPATLSKKPEILSYPASCLPAAIEFLSNMMMLPQAAIQSLCKSNPDLLIGGLDGYVQEQAVKDALGSASDAMYGLSKTVSADVGDLIRRDKGGKAKGL